MSLIYIENVTTNRTAFEKKVVDICAKLGIDPNWLMAVMYIESGLDPKAVNYQDGDDLDPYKRAAYRATGIIQFYPSTSITELKTSNQLIYNMTNVEQLDLVYQYLYKYRRKIKSFTDCYFAVFFPAALGRYSDYILQYYGLSAASVANENGGYDANKDNEITFREVESKILLLVDPSYRSILKSDSVPAPAVNWTMDRILLVALAAVIIVFGGYKLLKTL